MTGLHEFNGPENEANVVMTVNPKQDNSIVNLVNFDISDAVKFLNENEVPFEIEGPKKNAIVVSQSLVNDEKGKKVMKLVTGSGSTDNKSAKDNNAKMPDLKGMSLRKCIKVMSSLGMDFKVNGCGKVSNQVPEAGALLGKNQTVIINCDSPDKF
jgi:beta-lactam-binding protein with PASTA domain